MFGGRVHSRVAPLEIDVAILDFRHLPTGGRLGVQRREQRVTATRDLAIDRPLQRRAAHSRWKTLEGFTNALRFVLGATALGVQAFLAG
ncbi:hypothetical protein D3C76_1589590 [compost metagenome]